MSEERISESVLKAIEEAVLLCRHYVNHPEAVKADVEARGYSVLVGLHTDPDDVGQVIGRNAHLINSLRSFLSAIAGKNGVTVILDYVTEEDNRRQKD